VLKPLFWKELQQKGELGTVNQTKEGLKGGVSIWVEGENECCCIGHQKDIIGLKGLLLSIHQSTVIKSERLSFKSGSL